jgi:hypothetical protein
MVGVAEGGKKINIQKKDEEKNRKKESNTSFV